MTAATSWTALAPASSAPGLLEIAITIAQAIEPRLAGVANCSLASGLAGFAAFFGYLDATAPGRGFGRVSERCLERAIAGVADADWLEPSLLGGFTGVAWASEILGHADGADAGDPEASCDAVLLRLLERPSAWRHPFDLVGGVAGVAVYAQEALGRPGGQACMNGVAASLARSAARTRHGMAWHTPPQYLVERSRAAYPGGFYNLGLAHGAPGAITALALALSGGVEAARPLLEDAVAWLLAQRLPADSPSRFPFHVTEVPETVPARSAWCYGDPGVAIALLTAATHAGREDWHAAGIDVALHAARRPLADCGVVDAGLCHGSAGLMHMYGRLHQATGDARFQAAARTWLDATLGFLRPGVGIGGFQALSQRRDGEGLEWQDLPGVLEGAAGIGLALAAAASDIEPAWDRMLMMSTHAQALA